MDDLLVEFEPEIGFKKPLGRDFNVTELTKFIAGKEFLGLGGRISVNTTLRQANKIVTLYNGICFRYVKQLVRKDMTVKRKMLGSLSQEDEDMEKREAGQGQVYWAKDPTGDNSTLQGEFDKLPQREQDHAAWLQDLLTDFELYFSKEIISDAKLTDVLSLYNADRTDFSWKQWNNAVIGDLIDNAPIRVLETIVTIRRHPDGRTLKQWVQSFKNLRKLCIKYGTTLPQSIWYHYLMGQVTLAERTKDNLTLLSSPTERETFSLDKFEK